MKTKDYMLIPPKHGRPRKFINKDGRDGKWWSRNNTRIMIKLIVYFYHLEIFCCVRGEMAASMSGWFTARNSKELYSFIKRYPEYKEVRTDWIKDRIARRRSRPETYKTDDIWFIAALLRRVEMMYRSYPGNGTRGKISARSKEHPENNLELKDYLPVAEQMFHNLQSSSNL